jgi:hypothetical protein
LAVHAAMDVSWRSRAGRVLGCAGIGVLGRYVPPSLVDEVLAGCGAVQRRFRVLPARFGVYFVLGLCLFSHLGYDAVLREILSGLEGRLRAAGWAFPSTTALSRLRRRLGPQPFEQLSGRLAAALSPGTAVVAYLRAAGCGLGCHYSQRGTEPGKHRGARQAAQGGVSAGPAGYADRVRDPGAAGRLARAAHLW